MILVVIFIIFFYFLTPTSAQAGSFSGQLYEDPDAIPIGFGTSSDNPCDGKITSPIAGAGFKPKAIRTGEEGVGYFMGETYTVTTSTNNIDYKVVLQLPYPPEDPANAWQCACNANPLDPYQCVYTNQDPTKYTSLNFFIKRANTNNNAWWQVLGGSIYSKYHIQSFIPYSELPGYCNTTPGCVPALIDSDIDMNMESPGFAFTNQGKISTSQTTGNVFLHTTTSRSNAIQANAMSFDLPEEGYNYFYKKMQKEAINLPSSQKPVPSTNPGIYLHEGNFTINDLNSWHVTNSEQIIVFINGDLNIDDTSGTDQQIITVEKGNIGFLAFIVHGNINISANVGHTNATFNPRTANAPLVEGVFITDKIIRIDGLQDVSDKKFIGAGTFVGWEGIQLNRSFAVPGDNSVNNQEPAEVFIFRPDLTVNIPGKMKSAHFYAREIQPKSLQ